MLSGNQSKEIKTIYFPQMGIEPTTAECTDTRCAATPRFLRKLLQNISTYIYLSQID